jgi:BirA family biotin operon repressor/biotin-[acetyl-CoA-carboxylase] ligase
VNAERANAALADARFGRVEWVARTGSTNSDLMRRARAGDPEQTLVADEQTAGRGRLGRVWQAPPGASLLCSVLIRPGGRPAEASMVTMALGVAAADACETVAGVELGLKWPNDLVAIGVGPGGSDRKLSGLLAESVVAEGRIEAIVAGIGINVNWPDEIPADLADIATSLRHQAGHDVDRVELLVELLVRFEHHLDHRAGLDAAYRQRSATLGRNVRVERPDGDVVGRAVDFESDGALVIEVDGQNDWVTIHVGDVTHLRHC